MGLIREKKIINCNNVTPFDDIQRMYDHLAADLKKVKIKEEYLLPKAIREFKKELKFPAWRWYEYTVPSTMNKYVICFYAECRSLIEKPAVTSFAIVYDDKKRFVVQWIAGGYKNTPESPLMLIRQIHAYSSHFLERYNERFLKGKNHTANDVACRYLSRNQFGMPIEMNEDINKRLSVYGVGAKYGFRVRDGFCFAQSAVQGHISEDGDRTKDKVDAMLVLYTTFMNESDMKDTQLSAINKEHYSTWLRCLQDFNKEAKDGVISLTLEP